MSDLFSDIAQGFQKPSYPTPQTNQMLTPEEMKQLYASGYFDQHPEAIKKLSRPETDMFNSITKERFAGKDPTYTRQDSAVAGPDKTVPGQAGIPGPIQSLAPEDLIMLGQALNSGKHLIGGAARGFAESGGGFWEGIKGALRGILPQQVEQTAAAGGGEAASRTASKFTETAPMSDADYLAQTGHARGAQTLTPDPANLERVPKATSSTPGAYRRSVGRGASMDPPNLNRTASSNDVAEQVTGSSRKGYEDTFHSFDNRDYPLDEPSGKLMDDLRAALGKKHGASLRAPGGSAKLAKIREAEQGGKELEELLQRTGRLDPLEGSSNGLLPAEPPAPSRLRRAR